MKVYKFELVVIDHDEVGGEGIKDVLENARYPNRCINPDVLAWKCCDIGEWCDGHPLNQRATSTQAAMDLFADESAGDDPIAAFDELQRRVGQLAARMREAKIEEGGLYCGGCGRLIADNAQGVQALRDRIAELEGLRADHDRYYAYIEEVEAIEWPDGEPRSPKAALEYIRQSLAASGGHDEAPPQTDWGTCHACGAPLNEDGCSAHSYHIPF